MVETTIHAVVRKNLEQGTELVLTEEIAALGNVAMTAARRTNGKIGEAWAANYPISRVAKFRLVEIDAYGKEV